MSESLLTVSQVLAIPPGDTENPAWVSPGFSGTCRRVEKRQAGAKTMWPCTFADPETGDTISVTFWTAPKFSEGDEVRFTGKGMRRGEYQGKPEVKISGDKTTVEVRAGAPRVQAAIHGAQAQHATEGMIEGQAVGNGMTAVWELARYVYTPTELKEQLTAPGFWMWFHEVLSDHLRIASMVKSGKLADPVKVRQGQKPASGPRPEVRPAVQPRQSTVEQELDEDTPF